MYFSMQFFFLTIYTWISVTYGETTYHNNYVYFPELGVSYKFHKNPLTWGNARLSCLSENASLAIPKNKNEFDAIMQIFLLYPPNEIVGSTSAEYLLLDINDYFMEQVLVTESGFSLDYYYKNVDENQFLYNRNENVGGLQRNRGLVDYPNTWVLAYMCQKEDVPYADNLKLRQRVNSDPNYIPFTTSNKKYKLHIDIKPWGFAQAVCVAEGGHLAIIKNNAERMFLLDMMNLPKNRLNYGAMPDTAFVGYHDLYVEGSFLTVKGENYENILFPYWSSGEPNGGTGENCVIFDEIGNIRSHNCDVPLRYICEMDTSIHEDSYIRDYK